MKARDFYGKEKKKIKNVFLFRTIWDRFSIKSPKDWDQQKKLNNMKYTAEFSSQLWRRKTKRRGEKEKEEKAENAGMSFISQKKRKQWSLLISPWIFYFLFIQKTIKFDLISLELIIACFIVCSTNSHDSDITQKRSFLMLRAIKLLSCLFSLARNDTIASCV